MMCILFSISCNSEMEVLQRTASMTWMTPSEAKIIKYSEYSEARIFKYSEYSEARIFKEQHL